MFSEKDFERLRKIMVYSFRKRLWTGRHVIKVVNRKRPSKCIGISKLIKTNFVIYTLKKLTNRGKIHGDIE